MTFTNVHHIVPWKSGGRTDLDNLALLCLFHHGMVHRKGWTMTGQRQPAAALRRPERPGHDLAPFAPVDQGDGATPGWSAGLIRLSDEFCRCPAFTKSMTMHSDVLRACTSIGKPP